MSRRDRRKFTATFKTEVVLEALKERKTMSELAQQFDLQEVVDVTGRVVVRERLAVDLVRMDVAGLSAGSYTLRLSDGRAVAFVKR
jgi:hypothetical protein